MGRDLPWGHKHLHIEAENRKPKANHARGPVKKKDRVKGKKARIDELLAGRKRLEREAEWLGRARLAQQDRKQGINMHNTLSVKRQERWFDEERDRQTKIINAALKDGVIHIGDVAIYLVKKP